MLIDGCVVFGFRGVEVRVRCLDQQRSKERQDKTDRSAGHARVVVNDDACCPATELVTAYAAGFGVCFVLEVRNMDPEHNRVMVTDHPWQLFTLNSRYFQTPPNLNSKFSAPSPHSPNHKP